MENEFKELRSVTELNERLSKIVRQSSFRWNQIRITEIQKSLQWSSNIQIAVEEMQKSFRELERVSQNISEQLQKQMQEIKLGFNFDWSEPLQNAIRESMKQTNLITTNIRLTSNVMQQMKSQTMWLMRFKIGSSVIP